jgi:hypothetical protein
MGEVPIIVKLTNAADLALFRRGKLKKVKYGHMKPMQWLTLVRFNL